MNQSEMNKKAGIRLIWVFIACQLIPGFLPIVLPEQHQQIGLVLFSILVFAIGVTLVFWIEKKYAMHLDFEVPLQGNVPTHLLWGFLGSILLGLGYIAALFMEQQLFANPSLSRNTLFILGMIRQYPIFILVIGVLGPIIEEFVFRKTLFGLFRKQLGSIGAAVISSLIYSIAHLDGYFLLYATMGLILCWLYATKKNIWVPIIAHIGLNIFLVIFNLTSL